MANLWPNVDMRRGRNAYICKRGRSALSMRIWYLHSYWSMWPVLLGCFACLPLQEHLHEHVLKDSIKTKISILCKWIQQTKSWNGKWLLNTGLKCMFRCLHNSKLFDILRSWRIYSESPAEFPQIWRSDF